MAANNEITCLKWHAILIGFTVFKKLEFERKAGPQKSVKSIKQANWKIYLP